MSATQSGEPGAALEVTNLTAGYGETTVLRAVSLSVAAGSVTALLGANGAGKSTLLKTVAGLLRPSSGSVRINGQDMTNVAPSKRAQGGLCYIPEGRAIFRSLSVRDNIRVQAADGNGVAAEERVAEAFPALRDRMKQRAGTLSGGEQQMLAVARAYVTDPSLIVVDEASLGLAPKIVDAIFDSLSRLAEEGAVLLLVDQFAARVLEMASHAYVMRRGEIVYDGDANSLTASDLFARYVSGESVS